MESPNKFNTKAHRMRLVVTWMAFTLVVNGLSFATCHNRPDNPQSLFVAAASPMMKHHPTGGWFRLNEAKESNSAGASEEVIRASVMWGSFVPVANGEGNYKSPAAPTLSPSTSVSRSTGLARDL